MAHEMPDLVRPKAGQNMSFRQDASIHPQIIRDRIDKPILYLKIPPKSKSGFEISWDVFL